MVVKIKTEDCGYAWLNICTKDNMCLQYNWTGQDSESFRCVFLALVLVSRYFLRHKIRRKQYEHKIKSRRNLYNLSAYFKMETDFS